MLTNFFALDLLAKNDIDVTVIEGKKEIKVITGHTIFHGKKGDLLSLLPLKETAKNVVTKNLYYPLKQEDLLFGYSRGISNIFTAATAEVSLSEGSLLVIHEKVSKR